MNSRKAIRPTMTFPIVLKSFAETQIERAYEKERHEQSDEHQINHKFRPHTGSLAGIWVIKKLPEVVKRLLRIAGIGQRYATLHLKKLGPKAGFLDETRAIPVANSASWSRDER
jgi:hypothetical protein